MSKKYITTAIPYVNARPHIGHAMDYLLADIWARYQTAQGNEVRMSAGTDEHGTKVEQKARDNSVVPQEFVDGLVPSFLGLIEKMDVHPTDFVRTTDADHVRRVQGIWKKLDAAGVIYKSTYEGWYCSGCEAFVTETEAHDMNYKCPDHNRALEKLSEENYYLRVSDFTDQIREFIDRAVVPSFRGRELLELIKNGAQDVSISRPVDKLSWGVPVPGDAGQVMYVWVDALSNYITALGYPDDGWAADFWPADVEVIGKDILRFHAIIWPAMLLALGLELPRTLLAHGFVNADGVKMSKSIGNVIDPMEIIDAYGTEAFRYYFARHIPTFEDGDFTWEKFMAAYNGELANDLGNLVSRTANMVERYCGGEVSHSKTIITDNNWEKEYQENMQKFRFDLALESAWSIVAELNRQIEIYKPWEKYKIEQLNSDKDPFATSFDGGTVNEFLSNLVNGVLNVATLLRPFLPDTATKIYNILDADIITGAPILFPRIEK